MPNNRSTPISNYQAPGSAKEHLNDDFLFLVTCCQTEHTEEDINFIHSFIASSGNALGMQHSTSNIQNLISLASSHGILPLVYKTLKNLSEDKSSSSSYNTLLSDLKQHYMSIVQRNMLMTSELIKIIHLLRENDIEALSFKGPTLSQTAYGDITLRQFGDLDILIRKKDRSKMMTLLIREQYIPEIDLKKSTEETFFNCVNVIGLHKASSGVRVEVHWELLSRNYAIDWDEDALWTQKESVMINNITVPVLPTEQLLLYLCAHGAKHLFERIEWICDIDRSVKTNPDIDWNQLLNESKKLGITRMLYLGLALSQLFFNLKLPVEIEKNILKDKEIPKLISKVIKINFSETSQEGKNHSSFGLLWSMREKLSNKLHFAWRGLFSPKFDDFLFIQLPNHLAFLYPLVRPYRLARKYLPFLRSNT